MTDERDEKQAPFTQHPLETRTAMIAAAIVAVLCVAGAAVIVVAALIDGLS